MFTSNLIKVYQAERVRISAQIFDLDRQRDRGVEKLREIDALILGLETVAKHEAETAPQLAAEREAAERAAYERGKLETIAAAEAASAAAAAEPPRKRRRKS